MRRSSFWILFITLGFCWLSYIILDIIAYLVIWSNPGSENHQDASGTLWLMSDVEYFIFGLAPLVSPGLYGKKYVVSMRSQSNAAKHGPAESGVHFLKIAAVLYGVLLY
jgi:hypothetical protein